MADSLSLNVASFNCRGYNDSKRNYIRSLLSTVPVLFLQETWLSDSQLPQLGSINNNFLFAGCSGFDNSDILVGRPHGGVAILWRSDLSFIVSVLNTNSRRVCAVRMDSVDYKLLFINVYMPCEVDDSSSNEYADQLLAIEALCNNNPDCHVIAGGDYNVDFSRDRRHTVLLNDFCESTGLNPAIRHHSCNIDYTYSFNFSRFSLLDHFLLSGAMFENSVSGVSVLHDIDNLSDHEPIVLKLSLDVKLIGYCHRVHAPRESWVKATETDCLNYRCVLSQLLNSITLPVDTLLCADLRCHDISHFNALNTYAQHITDACLNAAKSCIPQTCDRQSSGRLPGWSDRVQPLRDKSLFWHRIWLDCNRPKTGVVADCMRRTRAAYHYAIRRLKKDEESIIRERIADAMLTDEGRNFWLEVKRLRSQKTSSSRIIDGQTDASSIASLFAAKYRELYSSVPYNKDELQFILDDVNSSLNDDYLPEDCIIHTHDVKSAVARLNPHKNEGGSSLSTDHLINAGDDFLTHIALLFTAISIHGAAPDSFHVSTIVPIPKGRNVNISDSSNFRGIALSPVYGKIFDNIILQQYNDKLMSSELQFGFKPKSSTNMCSMVLKETIAYYNSHNSSVFCSFLDATKAFDRLHYCKLFRLLIKRKLPAHIIRLLINIYTNNFVRVAWHGVMSVYFLAVNGVKQGGVLSPVLFCLYIDDLLLALSKSGVGCFIGNNFVGALAYADDIVLVAPTASALRKLLSICGDYATEYCISFNAAKSKCLMVLPKNRRATCSYAKKCSFSINNQQIDNVESFKHLGHVISAQMEDASDIICRRNDFIGQVNNLLCYFRKLTSCVKYRLFRSYCTSFYGCELWSLTTNKLQDLCTAWRKGVRSVWNLPQSTHCYLLPLICNCLPVFDEICRRSINFARDCITHVSGIIKRVASYGIYYARNESPLGQNMLFCIDRYRSPLNSLLFSSRRIVNSYFDSTVDDAQLSTASFLIELIDIRDGQFKFKFSDSFVLSYTELCDIITYICTC